MNRSISNLHLETLDKARKTLLLKLIPFTKNFVLGGGTALALQLNHRKSFDFDFFSSFPIKKVFLEKIFLQQLVYFGDLLNFEIIPSDKPLPKPQEVKSFFEDLIKNCI